MLKPAEHDDIVVSVHRTDEQFVQFVGWKPSYERAYISLSSQFGNASDTGAISILSLNDGPFFTLAALGATGLATIPFKSFVAVLVPLLIGFLWGNIDKHFREVCKYAQPIVTLPYDNFDWIKNRYFDTYQSWIIRNYTWTSFSSNSSYFLLCIQPSFTKEGEKCNGRSCWYNGIKLSSNTCSCR